jgi:glutamate---cysteine ligase / carboxylate-amine ligase
MALPFKASRPLTLGTEIELQLIDGTSWDLSPSSIGLLEEAEKKHVTGLCAELFQSMIELNSGICRDAHEVETDLRKTALALKALCAGRNLHLSGTGTHPFGLYKDRKLYPKGRYFQMIEKNQWLGRRLAIFGVHVHLGMSSGDECIEMMNRWLHFLPHLLALTASSPFWEAESTGLASARGTIFESIPTGGHPCALRDWKHYEAVVEALTHAQAIGIPKDLWWDLRPSPELGTLELRICDGAASLPLLFRVVALIHGIAAAMKAGVLDDRVASPVPDWMYRENKWRAARYGLDAPLLIDPTGTIRPLRDDLKALLKRLGPTLNRLGYEDWKPDFHALVDGQTSSDRQVQVFRFTKSLVEVAKANVLELESSLEPAENAGPLPRAQYGK